MTVLQPEADPAELGLSAGRLARIDRHFDGYSDDGRLAGWLVAVSRHGRVAHVACGGVRDLRSGIPVTSDTVWRWFSMTKPITAVAALMLHEEGAFDLTDPVERWIPSLGALRVYTGGPAAAPATRPALEPVRVWHLLTHTAGFTYGFLRTHPVDAIYRHAGYEWGWPPGTDLATAVDAWAGMPLLFEPGAEWAYSVATDVLGRLVEVASGLSLDEFFRTRIFEPLGMADAGFWAGGDAAGRLATLYGAHPETRRPVALPGPFASDVALRRPSLLSGGGGALGTAHDYHRFTQMLLRGGELDGVRLLGPRTVALMTSNHLPGGADLEAVGRPLFAETTFAGVGFGLGVGVTIDPAKAKVAGSPGEYHWGGAASTAFFVDPVEDLTAVFMTQLLPSSTHPIRRELRALVYQAIVGD